MSLYVRMRIALNRCEVEHPETRNPTMPEANCPRNCCISYDSILIFWSLDLFFDACLFLLCLTHCEVTSWLFDSERRVFRSSFSLNRSSIHFAGNFAGWKDILIHVALQALRLSLYRIGMCLAVQQRHKNSSSQCFVHDNDDQTAMSMGCEACRCIRWTYT